MKNLVTLIAVLCVFASLRSISMPPRPNPSLSDAKVGSSIGQHIQAQREYNLLYNNPNRTAEEQARFEEITDQRKKAQSTINQSGTNTNIFRRGL